VTPAVLAARRSAWCWSPCWACFHLLGRAIAAALGLAIAAVLAATVFDLSEEPPRGSAGAAPRARWPRRSIPRHDPLDHPARAALYEFQKRTGAIGRIRDTLAGLTRTGGCRRS
jgi:hypothetical protein